MTTLIQYYCNTISQFICRLYRTLVFLYQRHMQNPSPPARHSLPKRIVDYKITNQHYIFYLVIWDDHAKLQEWVQDTVLVGCEKLIEDFFTSIQQDQELELDIEDPNSRGRKKPGQPLGPFQTKWNIDCSRLAKIFKNKNLQKRMKLKGGKKRQKKYINDDIRLILQKIDALDRYIDTQRPASQKLDYLLNYVVSVFKKGDMPYFSVRTLPPERNLSVSLDHMERFFPQTLKDYYRGLLKLHTRKLMQNEQNGMVAQQEQSSSSSSSDSDSGDSSSQKSKEIRSTSENSGSRGLYEQMND